MKPFLRVNHAAVHVVRASRSEPVPPPVTDKPDKYCQGRFGFVQDCADRWPGLLEALKAEDSRCVPNLAGKLKDVNDILMSCYRYDHNKSLPYYVFLPPDEIQIKQLCADIAKLLGQ